MDEDQKVLQWNITATANLWTSNPKFPIDLLFSNSVWAVMYPYPIGVCLVGIVAMAEFASNSLFLLVFFRSGLFGKFCVPQWCCYTFSTSLIFYR
jgi:hypothetical protein